MGKLAFIFPGQGSQSVGMGKALFEAFPEARAVFEAADDALSEKLSTLCFEGPDEQLKLTANTQPSILTVSIAAHAVFSKRCAAPSFVAGHSLGEYSALVAAQALSLPDAVRAVRARGTFMQEAVPKGVGAMAAVLGLPPEKVKEICDACAMGQVLAPANYNEPSQTVIAGHAEAVERASVKLKEAGAKRVLPLPVSAPFHCALMEPVKSRLAAVFAHVAVKAPTVPVVSNVEATPNADASRIVPLLLSQVSAPVRWIECVEELQRQGVTRMVELGPGKVLGGLVKRIAKGEAAIECFNVEDPASLEKTLAALGGASKKDMLKDFAEKVVLVTGGSRGIGRAICLAFARRGASVVFSYHGNEIAAKETIAQIEGSGAKATAIRFDVADTAACASTVEAIVKEQGRLDVLVNNAGVAVDGLVMRFKDEDWDRVLDTNLKGAFALIRSVSRPMMKQKGGAIVNLTSVVGEMGNGGQSAYAASKAGLVGLTKSIAKELASRNIRVNAVSPGFIDTDMTAKIPEELRKQMLGGIPLARLGSADEVANAVAFLASDQAGYITGEVLKVNGGMYM